MTSLDKEGRAAMDSIDETEAFERGREMRRAVLGDAHVARSGGGSREDANDLQRYVTQFGWGTIWQRGVLPLSTRSLVTVSMLLALNRPHEIEVHLSGALNNGCYEQEVREVILHGIAYCGFPAAIDAMRIFDRVLEARSAAPADDA